VAPAVWVSCNGKGYLAGWIVEQVVDDAQVVDDWYGCGVMWGGATDSGWIEEGEVGCVCRRRIVEGA
jgi:hypothetical protein